MIKRDIVMDAVRAQNKGHFREAAALFQEAGNQERKPSEKNDLWAAAQKARDIANSD